MAQDGAPRHGSLLFPILLITIGGLFLYANWRPSFDPWPVLTTYWPLILIFLGLGKMWDVSRRRQNPDAPRSSVGATVGILAVVLLLFALLWHGRAFSHGRRFSSSLRHDARTVDLEGAKTVRADLSIGAGQLTLRGGSSHLLDADFDYFAREGSPQVEYTVDAGKGELKISQEGGEPNIGGTNNTWSLHFGNSVPLDLKIDMGAGEGDLRLRDLDVTNLNVNMGAGRVEVDLTGDRKKDLDADIEGGVGQAVIRLPRKIGVIVNASGGIGTIDASGLKHDGDEYTNAAYGKSPVTIRLKVEGGVGQISLIQEP
ncbi:MAG TPA: toast rack family protein [Candidatus Acidoferrum sp.]|jgi:hypothetical protein|nr:toast rack family protein [Candidatus Acidoferrum sp.]